MSGKACDFFQLIDGQGVFNEVGLKNFVEAVKLSQKGRLRNFVKAEKLSEQDTPYVVVSIMGPQSSGKSTLLNYLFHTNFREMDARKGRSQTTQGIWHSQAVGIEPCTLVIDVEGTDGRERGEDDTTFEKQSALFALVVSDIVLINMWCHDIGREQAASKPLLKTVFQAMLRLFDPRKTTLLFVIRDKTKTPFEVLEPIIREDIQKIWISVPKHPKHSETPLSDFFNIEVTALPSYEQNEECFKKEVSVLRKRFSNSTALGGLAADRREFIPVSGFPLMIKKIWETIKKNKDLNLPAQKVMVAAFRCEEIAKDSIEQLVADEDWRKLKEAVLSGPVVGFGKRLNAILERCFSSYDSEALYFEEGVRRSKRQKLVTESLNLVYPAYQAMMERLYSKVLRRFKYELEENVNNGKGFAAAIQRCKKDCMAEFEQGCKDAKVQQANWDYTEIRNKLERKILSKITRAEPTNRQITMLKDAAEKAAKDAAEKDAKDEAGKAAAEKAAKDKSADPKVQVSVMSAAATTAGAIATTAATAITAATGGTAAPVAIPVAIAAAAVLAALVPFVLGTWLIKHMKNR